MFKNNKLLVVASVALVSVMVTACGAEPTGSDDSKYEDEITLKVWCAPEETELMKGTYLDGYQAMNPTTKINLEVTGVAEGEAASSASQNNLEAADVIAFVDDNIKPLLTSGFLAPITGTLKANVIENSIPWTVDAASIEEDGNDVLYGIPQTSDNGYFLYYDKSVISDEQAKSFETVAATAKAAGKKFFFDITNGYYIPAFFQAAGGEIAYNASTNVQEINYNNPGLGNVVFDKLYDFYGSDNYGATMQNGDDTVVTSGFADGSIVAGITGLWNSKAIKASLGDDYGIVKLPTFDFGGDIGVKNLYSLMGAKLVGIKASSRVLNHAILFANHITTEQAQLQRFEERGTKPANAEASSSAAVLASAELAVLSSQEEYSTSQASACGPNFWDPLQSVGDYIVNQTKDGLTSQEIMDQAVSSIKATDV